MIRYWDGQLLPKRAKAVQSHLHDCGFCRTNYNRFYVALQEVRQETAYKQVPQPNPGILASIRQRIPRFEANKNSPQRRQAMKRLVADQIGPFLGNKAAAALLELVSENCQNLLSTVEPVLADFLGSRAASDLVNRVLDASIVRI